MKIVNDISPGSDENARLDEQLGRLLVSGLNSPDNQDGTRTSCPSIEDIAALAEAPNTFLSPQERDHMMKHLSECDDCYETFMLTMELHQSEKTKRVFFKPWALAATLLIAVCSIYVFYHSTSVPRSPEQLLDMAAAEESAVADRKAGKAAASKRDTFERKPLGRVELKSEKRAAHSKDADAFKAKKGARPIADDGYHINANNEVLDKVKKPAPKPHSYKLAPQPAKKGGTRLKGKKEGKKEEIEEERGELNRAKHKAVSKRRRSSPKPVAVPEAMQQAQAQYQQRAQQQKQQAQQTTAQQEQELQQQQQMIRQQDPSMNFAKYPPRRRKKGAVKEKPKESDDLEAEQVQRQLPRAREYFVDGMNVSNLSHFPLLVDFKRAVVYRGTGPAPNIDRFLAKSTPGSIEHQFFTLARSGWCIDALTCFDALGKPKTLPKKDAAKLLAQWKKLLPQLTDIYKIIAQTTIKNLQE